MPTVKAGYLGYAEISGTKVRCTDFNVQVKQDVLFYDHTIGLRDNIPSAILGGKGDQAQWNEQKIFWRAATKIIEGNVSFPMSEFSANAFFDQAWKGDWFDFSLYYSCENGKMFKECRVNTYNFSITAGDVANVSVGVIGKNISEATPAVYDRLEKLITWDKVEIGGVGDQIVSLDFTINNNCIPIYTSGTNTGGISPLIPNDIRVGMQSLTGSVSFYNNAGPTDSFVEVNTPQFITISAGSFNATLNVLYQYPERNGAVSAYIKTVPFVGVGHAVEGV
jgi:hypothetical protein